MSLRRCTGNRLISIQSYIFDDDIRIKEWRKKGKHFVILTPTSFKKLTIPTIYSDLLGLSPESYYGNIKNGILCRVGCFVSDKVDNY